MGAKKISLNQETYKIIENSMVETFFSFFGVKPVLEKIEEQPALETERCEISGIIAFIQDDLEGTMTIRFKKQNLFELLQPIYGDDLQRIDNRAVGAVGEFSNVIHSIAKHALNVQGYNYQMCLPVVIVGENHQISTHFTGKKAVLHFKLNGGLVLVELVFRS
jgi:CheY-specific phosphatase CheX